MTMYRLAHSRRRAALGDDVLRPTIEPIKAIPLPRGSGCFVAGPTQCKLVRGEQYCSTSRVEVPCLRRPQKEARERRGMGDPVCTIDSVSGLRVCTSPVVAPPAAYYYPPPQNAYDLIVPLSRPVRGARPMTTSDSPPSGSGSTTTPAPTAATGALDNLWDRLQASDWIGHGVPNWVLVAGGAGLAFLAIRSRGRR